MLEIDVYIYTMMNRPKKAYPLAKSGLQDNDQIMTSASSNVEPQKKKGHACYMYCFIFSIKAGVQIWWMKE